MSFVQRHKDRPAANVTRFRESPLFASRLLTRAAKLYRYGAKSAQAPADS